MGTRMPTQNSVKPGVPAAGPRTPFAEELAAADAEALPNLITDPRLDEDHLCLLLQRKELSSALLDEIARRRGLLDSYRVKRALAFHPHVSRPVAHRLLRELHLMDLVKLSRAPATPADLRRAVEDHLVGRFPQVALGQKIALARQASPPVLAALIAEGNVRVVETALGNPLLTEAQVLKLLAKEKLPTSVIPSMSRHDRWNSLPNVRLALLRHPQTPLEAAQRILPHVPFADLRALARLKSISSALRKRIEHELFHR